MIQILQNILKQSNILFHQNQGITIATVANLSEGFSLAKTILYAIVDQRTVLYLSGGSTPKVLYERFAAEEKLVPGAIGVVDERFGPKFHETSNEKMFQNTGMLRYLRMRSIPFYPILEGKSREQTTEKYDGQLRTLNATYQRSVAILGIGADGHTAGIPAQSSGFRVQGLEVSDNYDLVMEYNDTSGKYGERVTMTFLALSMMDVLLVLVFGEEKKKALALMFQDGREEEIPARFFKRPEISEKTLLITDQSI